ncbi:MAG: tRNA 2-thiouridine(34) synthase MnmA [Candidatus Gracilibacteria bacterium]|jgi:tRNA-specific 2-thiouridylase|nr:tRNA 2-thiouridine(34) synthase MnmA [Candidatus Gracilibacteria bacterium]
MKKEQVLIGLSGGVDSSVAVLLLQEQGYEVVGAHFLVNKSSGSLKKATEIAKKLKIKLCVMQTQDLFKERVVDKFIAEWKKGLTPNPCVFCNLEFKTDVLFALAKDLGIEKIATGHYVQKIDGFLHRAKDLSKDQTFFLSRLTKDLVKNMIFPLGSYQKDEVRKIAKDRLGIEFDSESQDLCFVDGDIKDFLKNELEVRNGEIRHFKTKELLDTHDGSCNFTIGQRAKISGQAEPLFVKNIQGDTVFVSNNEDLFTKEMLIRDISWYNFEPQGEVFVQVRHRSTSVKSLIKGEKITFFNKVRAVTPGQSVAIYSEEILIGGAVIKK